MTRSVIAGAHGDSSPVRTCVVTAMIAAEPAPGAPATEKSVPAVQTPRTTTPPSGRDIQKGIQHHG